MAALWTRPRGGGTRHRSSRLSAGADGPAAVGSPAENRHPSKCLFSFAFLRSLVLGVQVMNPGACSCDP
jgi:hypothetical protein